VGALWRGNQGERVTASTQRLQGVDLGGGAVGGDQIQWRRNQAQAMWEEGDDRCGKCGLRRGALLRWRWKAGWRQRSRRDYWAGRRRRQPEKEWAGAASWAGWANFHREKSKGF
jgi:hypothetical protein